MFPTFQQPIPIYGPETRYHNRTVSTTPFQRFAFGKAYTSTSNYNDRMIPPRRELNVDIAKHKLGEKYISVDDKPYLDVIGQMKLLHTDWKKRMMTESLNEIEPFQGLKDQRILSFNSKQRPLSTPSCYKPGFDPDKRSSVIKKSSIDDVWKAKSRCKPLLKCWESAVELSGYIHFPSRGMIDWSSKNMMLVAVEQEILVFKDSWETQCVSAVVNIEAENIGTQKIRGVKWNHAGDRFVMYSESLKLCCYDITAGKIIWKHNCSCPRCSIRCIAWSKTDRQVFTGCNNGKLSIFTINGSYIAKEESVIVHEGSVLDMVISPDDQYIATTGADKNISIYQLKGIVPFLEIGYYDPSEALAWHPWEKGVLCIGGGIGDGSLSLWDIPKQKSLDYRRVNFLSRVKHLAWNKLSGELVVVWYYWEGTTRSTTIPVLASWNRIVDGIIIQKNTDSLSFNHRIANVVWNPHHTRLGIQTGDRLYLYNFFDDSSSEWEDTDKNKIRPAGQRSIFDLNCIR
ncbi:Similar to cort: Protein cortex (Heliconius melpomene) [Cotesia congregata]|uniref:Similar to cort: Protein cortex (Heliconius melpomene) n=1 Tax=Cotesia congregata TaxID=51543 RepID=A0A8J2HBJ7_COTCN|nr:Similar to cort: Protein cortex (Heliconius melpomene) [Cotesia congregata]